MSRFRDDYPMLPSHAAILRQQTARAEDPAYLGAVIDNRFGDDRFGAPGIADGQQQKQQDCWVISDQEEALIYI